MEFKTITTNVKRMLPGDVYKPNGVGREATVERVELRPNLDELGRQLSGGWVDIHHVGGGHRAEHHSKRRTVRRPVS